MSREAFDRYGLLSYRIGLQGMRLSCRQQGCYGFGEESPRAHRVGELPCGSSFCGVNHSGLVV